MLTCLTNSIEMREVDEEKIAEANQDRLNMMIPPNIVILENNRQEIQCFHLRLNLWDFKME